MRIKKVVVFSSLMFLMSCNSSIKDTENTNGDDAVNQPIQIEEESYTYSVDDTINGQILTVSRLKKYMELKEYDKAISLFSEKQQAKINSIRNSPQDFDYWCKLWTLDNKSYKVYVYGIKNNKGIFIFENGEWKINEN